MSAPSVVYPSDLTDVQWAILEPFFYLLRGGCAWRILQLCFPPWSTVYHYCRQWRVDRTWAQIHTILREREGTRQGPAPQPTAAATVSQSVKTTRVRGVRGYDGAKKLSGRKRLCWLVY